MSTPSNSEAQREVRLLDGLARALQALLDGHQFDDGIRAALEIIGDASSADRVYVFDVLPDTSGEPAAMRQLFEWTSAGSSPQIDNAELQNLPFEPGFTAWRDTLRRRESITARIADRPASERILLEPQDILAIAVVPIFARSRFWGFVGFDNCRSDRLWAVEEIHLLEAFAASLGSAIENDLTRRELIEANAQLAEQAAELKRGRRVALSLIEDAQLEHERAAAANEAKSTFLATMSHEMRTPLNGILGFVDLLLADDLSDGHRDSLDTIASSGRTLLRLINDLLDLARIESGAIELQPTTGAFRECLAPDIATLAKLAEQKNVALHFDVDPGVPEVLELDFGRYRQMLMNIVGNAVKFTDHGVIRIGIRSSETSATAVTLDCVVRDTGDGIPPEALERIFNPFGQAHHSIQRRFGGTGLGLAICRDLCHLMGGRIDVASQLGEGSTFQFSVQAHPAQHPDPSSPPTRGIEFPHLAATHPARILVVDDVAINRKLLASFLGKIGYTPEFAKDGSEAIVLAADQPFDVILMDVFMPQVDGCEATRRIRAAENGTTHTHIVGISADAMAENRHRCASAGMDGFLTKPIHLADLLDTLRSGLENRPRSGPNSVLSGPEQNRTETEQNRIGRQFKTGLGGLGSSAGSASEEAEA